MVMQSSLIKCSISIPINIHPHSLITHHKAEWSHGLGHLFPRLLTSFHFSFFTSFHDPSVPARSGDVQQKLIIPSNLLSSFTWSGMGIALKCSGWSTVLVDAAVGLTTCAASWWLLLLSSSLRVIAKGSGTVGANFRDWGALCTLTLGLLESPSVLFKLSIFLSFLCESASLVLLSLSCFVFSSLSQFFSQSCSWSTPGSPPPTPRSRWGVTPPPTPRSGWGVTPP